MSIRRFERVRVICMRDGAILLVQHRGPDGTPFWLIPGGGIKEGETVEQAAMREIWEETGIHRHAITDRTPIGGLTPAYRRPFGDVLLGLARSG